MALLAKTTTATFDADVLGHDGVVLVDADWCGPCKAVEPALEDLAREYEGEVKIIKVDSDAEPDLRTRYNIAGIPAFLVIKNGELVDRFTGSKTRGQIAAIIEKQLGNA